MTPDRMTAPPSNAGAPTHESEFLGYDIRRVRGGEHPVFRMAARGSILSIDLVVCERPEAIDDDSRFGEPGRTMQGLFLSYEEACRAYEVLPKGQTVDSEIIGVSVAIGMNPQPELEEELGSYLDMRHKAELRDNYRVEGYDIGTLQYVWISALTNCGLDLVDAGINAERDLTSTWLLRSYSRAEALRVYADKAIPSHSPFAVWELFRVFQGIPGT